MMVVCAFQTNQLLDRIYQLSERTDALYQEVIEMELVYETVYKHHLSHSIRYAPTGMSIYQLRGEAQLVAQTALNYLTTKNKIPPHNLSSIRFRGALRRNAAGQATPCDMAKRIISLNEILYHRHYEEFIHAVIPHEVAHVFVCLNGGDADTDPHGPEWESAMIDMHFLNPDNEKTHEMDMQPVYEYQMDLSEALGELGY